MTTQSHAPLKPSDIKRRASGVLSDHRGGAITSISLLTIALLLMLPFRSISLDDFDSYSFALALKDFDLHLQQPQPPGFPVYIAVANLIYALRADPVTALTLTSTIHGALSIWLIYQLGRLLDPEHRLTGLCAALLFAVIPVSWLTSEKALSDMPGLAWTLLSVWQWLHWRARRPGTVPVTAAVLTGLSLGVRPQNALPTALLVGAYILCDLAKKNAPRLWLEVAGLGLVGVLLWLIPTAAMSGGFSSYLALIRAHARHVGQTDALLGMATPLPLALRIRLIAFTDTWLTAVTGGGLYLAASHTAWHFLPWGLAILPGFVCAGWRRRETKALGIWALGVSLQVLIFETLDRPRLFLPLMPPLVLLMVMGWANIARRRWMRVAVLVVGYLALITQTVPLVSQLSRIPAPPAQAVAYIRAHYPVENTLVAAAGSFRAAQVELSDYPLVYLYAFDPEMVEAALVTGESYVAILDRDQFTNDALTTLSDDGTLVTLEDLVFKRDRRVHTQHDQVRLQILAPRHQVPAEALKLPGDGCIDLGTDSDGRYLGTGWYRAEDVSGTTARWAGGETKSTLRIMLETNSNTALQLRVLPYPADQTVVVGLDGNDLGAFPLTQGWSVIEIPLPGNVTPASNMISLELEHSKMQSPFELTGGASSDRRELTAAYDWVCVSPPDDTSGAD